MHTEVEGLKYSLRRLMGSEIKISPLQLFLQHILSAKPVILDNVHRTKLSSLYSGQIFMQEDSDTSTDV